MGKAIYNTLLIDDDKTTNLLNQLLLLKHGCFGKIHTLLNGKIALEQLTKDHTDSICPDIIFLDLDMPGIDGWDFLNLLNSARKDIVESVPIILLTSIFTYDTIQNARKNTSIWELINKPLNFETANRIYTQYFGTNTIKLRQ